MAAELLKLKFWKATTQKSDWHEKLDNRITNFKRFKKKIEKKEVNLN